MPLVLSGTHADVSLTGKLLNGQCVGCLGTVTELRYRVIYTPRVAQQLKCLPAMQETRVQSLGREDLLEKEMATHFSTLAWRIPRTEEPGGLLSTGSQRVGHN